MAIHRLKPPADLDIEAAFYFHEIVQSLPPGHFIPCDIRTLCAHCHALVALDRANAGIALDGEVQSDRYGILKATPWVAIRAQALGSIASLAVKLRLTPSSRQRMQEIKEQLRTQKGRRQASVTEQEEQEGGSGLAGLTFQQPKH